MTFRTLLLLFSALGAGCAVDAQEEIGVVQEAALNPNALNPNALNPNALNPNALSPGAMSAIQDPGQAGALSRELLRYTVGCAFSSGQSFDFFWMDDAGAEHAESYPGLLGLATSWENKPLDVAGQQWVSACLASRVNAKGVSVMLSSRGTHPALATTAAERSTYQVREAVFFGNLFTASPEVYTCYDPLSTVPSQLANRVCAEPGLLALNLNNLLGGYDCGPIKVVGPCSQLLLGIVTLGVCSAQDPTARYLYNCVQPGGTTTVPAITTFLQGGLL